MLLSITLTHPDGTELHTNLTIELGDSEQDINTGALKSVGLPSNAEHDIEYTQLTLDSGRYATDGIEHFLHTLSDDDQAITLGYIEVIEPLNPIDLYDISRYAQDAYQGAFDSFKQFAEAIIDDLYNVPDNLAGYIDYEKLGDDLKHDYTLSGAGRMFKAD